MANAASGCAIPGKRLWKDSRGRCRPGFGPAESSRFRAVEGWRTSLLPLRKAIPGRRRPQGAGTVQLGWKACGSVEKWERTGEAWASPEGRLSEPVSVLGAMRMVLPIPAAFHGITACRRSADGTRRCGTCGRRAHWPVRWGSARAFRYPRRRRDWRGQGPWCGRRPRSSRSPPRETG